MKNSTWIKTESDEVAVKQGCYFDERKAERVATFFRRYLRHAKGAFAGKPFELLDWQYNDVIAPAFGWMQADGTRRFQKVELFVPKKNGKSTLLSGISAYHMACDDEPGAEVYSVAADREQASIIYREAVAMIKASPILRKQFKIRQSGKAIFHPRTNSFYKAISAIAHTKEGYNIHALLFDEIHAQPNSDLWNVLKYGGAARRQPLYWMISTAGLHDESAMWWEIWTHALNVISSKIIDTTALCVVYKADESDDWTSEATWKKANPSYGTALYARHFVQECEDARKNAAKEAIFKRYRLNIPVRASSGWIQPIYWDSCRVETKPDLSQAKTIVALDLASTVDICSAVAVHRTDKALFVEPYFWVPKLRVEERERSNRQKFSKWIDEGFLKQTPEAYTDYKIVHDDVFAICKKSNALELAIDSWNFTQLALDLQNTFRDKRVGTKIVAVRTGFASISSATKEIERLILQGRLQFAKNPVLDWMFSNIVIEQDANGNQKPDRKRSSDKIDGIVAIILALARFLLLEEKPKSKYESHGLNFATI